MNREFFNHLHDTLVLLGVDIRFAELITNPETIMQITKGRK